tara:strand:- start:76 stop:537 length:462 start_codon:yes stop_codon:yes gene_type:complete
MELIPNYPNYSISIDGKTVIGCKGEMRIQTNNCGYRVVQLTHNGKKHSFSIAKLLALTFIPNPENKRTIDHINRDRSDDRIENLRWATDQEQGFNKGTYSTNTSGVKNISIKKRGQKIYQYEKKYKGVIYKTTSYSMPEACFEQFCHSRMISL